MSDTLISNSWLSTDDTLAPVLSSGSINDTTATTTTTATQSSLKSPISIDLSAVRHSSPICFPSSLSLPISSTRLHTTTARMLDTSCCSSSDKVKKATPVSSHSHHSHTLVTVAASAAAAARSSGDSCRSSCKTKTPCATTISAPVVVQQCNDESESLAQEYARAIKTRWRSVDLSRPNLLTPARSHHCRGSSTSDCTRLDTLPKFSLTDKPRSSSFVARECKMNHHSHHHSHHPQISQAAKIDHAYRAKNSRGLWPAQHKQSSTPLPATPCQHSTFLTPTISSTSSPIVMPHHHNQDRYTLRKRSCSPSSGRRPHRHVYTSFPIQQHLYSLDPPSDDGFDSSEEERGICRLPCCTSSSSPLPSAASILDAQRGRKTKAGRESEQQQRSLRPNSSMIESEYDVDDDFEAKEGSITTSTSSLQKSGHQKLLYRSKKHHQKAVHHHGGGSHHCHHHGGGSHHCHHHHQHHHHHHHGRHSNNHRLHQSVPVSSLPPPPLSSSPPPPPAFASSSRHHHLPRARFEARNLDQLVAKLGKMAMEKQVGEGVDAGSTPNQEVRGGGEGCLSKAQCQGCVQEEEVEEVKEIREGANEGIEQEEEKEIEEQDQEVQEEVEVMSFTVTMASVTSSSSSFSPVRASMTSRPLSYASSI